MKRFCFIVLALLMAVGAMAQDKKLVVWSFTDELQKMLAYYQKDNPDVKIDFTLVPNDVYQSKLKPVLQSGQGAPDVYTLESAYVKGYVSTGWMGDLTASANNAGKNTVQYTKDVVTDANGRVHGLSWQATPGAFFYRRSLAKEYLGTDDPEKIQALVSNLKGFVATAEKLKTASKGKAVLISSTGDLFQVFKSGRKSPWVVNNTLVVDPVMESLLDVAKTFHDKGYEGRQAQWSEGWFAGMKGALADEKGNPVEVFGYLLPTWGLHYVLKPNATSKSADGKETTTAGDWAMVQGPIPYFWGGTWVTYYTKTKQKAEAIKLIEYLTTNEKFLTAWAKDTGDLVSNTKVVDAIKGTYSEPFLGGQNHYLAFSNMAKNINAKVLSGYDQEIETIFQEQLAAYQNGEKDKKTAIQDFKDGVASQFPDLKVN
jgi:ABC-type glycerol-3-phosphate transport system substrate-binding protein